MRLSVLLSPVMAKKEFKMRVSERRKKIDRVLQVIMWVLLLGTLYFGNMA